MIIARVNQGSDPRYQNMSNKEIILFKKREKKARLEREREGDQEEGEDAQQRLGKYTLDVT